jgi:penicillin-binding protein 2
LAALHDETITEKSTIYAPAFLQFPGHKIRNASGRAEGSIAVKYALARSCNTWFAQVGIDCGPNNFLAMARRLGYGEKSGLPLVGEATGLIPTNEWMLANQKRRFMNGDSLFSRGNFFCLRFFGHCLGSALIRRPCCPLD